MGYLKCPLFPRSHITALKTSGLSFLMNSMRFLSTSSTFLIWFWHAKTKNLVNEHVNSYSAKYLKVHIWHVLHLLLRLPFVHVSESLVPLTRLFGAQHHDAHEWLQPLFPRRYGVRIETVLNRS